MKRVLIVDDAIFARFILRQILEKNDFEVVGEAKDGREGIDKYFELKPDVVTMDITMPVMDGLTALKMLKEKEPAANVVMVSAMGQKSFIKDAVMNGAEYFIIKPFEEEMVVQAIRKAGEGSKNAGAADV